MAKATATTIDVSYRALLGRIERALRAHGQQLRADRRRGGVSHFLIDTKKRAIVEVNVDIEKLARKLDVLQPWEGIERNRAIERNRPKRHASQ
jgi:hypothetical protein